MSLLNDIRDARAAMEAAGIPAPEPMTMYVWPGEPEAALPAAAFGRLFPGWRRVVLGPVARGD